MDKPGLLDDIPHESPALSQAQEISVRAVNAGFEWDDMDGVWAQLEEEKQEFLEALGTPEASGELGDMLFTLVNVARWNGIDAEAALKECCDKFRARWGTMERLAREQGSELEEVDRDTQEALWREAKRILSVS